MLDLLVESLSIGVPQDSEFRNILLQKVDISLCIPFCMLVDMSFGARVSPMVSLMNLGGGHISDGVLLAWRGVRKEEPLPIGKCLPFLRALDATKWCKIFHLFILYLY